MYPARLIEKEGDGRINTTGRHDDVPTYKASRVGRVQSQLTLSRFLAGERAFASCIGHLNVEDASILSGVE